jgi:hypothetical protein
MADSENKSKKPDDVSDDTKGSNELIGKLHLKVGSKYDQMVSSSLESFKVRDESIDISPIMDGAEEVEPWSLKNIKIFGSTWFNLLVLFFMGNALYSLYLGAVAVEGISGVEAERERLERLPGIEDDLAPFRPFLSLSPSVSDGDYSSFVRALNALNSYFPREVFDKTALFAETGFSFHPGGLSYIDPE